MQLYQGDHFERGFEKMQLNEQKRQNVKKPNSWQLVMFESDVVVSSRLEIENFKQVTMISASAAVPLCRQGQSS